MTAPKDVPEDARLEPCPFCGSDDVLLLKGGPTLHDAIRCRPCNLFVPLTAAEWNRRASLSAPAVPEEVGKLVEALDALHEKATPGPWVHRQAGERSDNGRQYDWLADNAHHGQHNKIICGRDAFYGGTHDYALVSALRNAYPTLRAALQSTASALAEMTRERDAALLSSDSYLAERNSAREVRREVCRILHHDHAVEGATKRMQQLAAAEEALKEARASASEKLYQELDPELRWILSQLCFECIHTAAALRQMGHEIPKRAEDEQAASLNWMLGLYAKHGAGWREIAIATMKEASAAHKLAPGKIEGEKND